MDLRQYLIAPHEQLQSQRSHDTSDLCVGFQHQQQQQRLEDERITREQVLRGLALYPDILASILQMREHDATQSQSDQTAFESQTLLPNSGGLISANVDSHHNLIEQEFSRSQRRRDSIHVLSQYPSTSTKRTCPFNQQQQSQTRNESKLLVRQPPPTAVTSKACKAIIPPTSPKAGRHGKSQQLQLRQQVYHSNAIVKAKASVTAKPTSPALPILKRKVWSCDSADGSEVGLRVSASKKARTVERFQSGKDTPEPISNTTKTIPSSTKPIPSTTLTIFKRAHYSLAPYSSNPPINHSGSLTYTTSPPKPHRGIPRSGHHKLHSTCFLWYHGVCPSSGKGKKGGKGNGKRCKFLHALTQPPSFVQPPRGFTHRTEDDRAEVAREIKCPLDWCPEDWLWDHNEDKDKDKDEESEEFGVQDSNLEDEDKEEGGEEECEKDRGEV
ncbi:hypothetical protein QM012_005431 [Aureobasidium pullulans]|uniref:C3H1-type domain-containing protein n=1 Tax=Aureobasidium pullulans TaxID=5580 RepID=A0ABR0T4S1_AURPU